MAVIEVVIGKLLNDAGHKKERKLHLVFPKCETRLTF